MEEILREPVELTDDDLDKVVGGAGSTTAGAGTTEAGSGATTGGGTVSTPILSVSGGTTNAASVAA